MGNGTSLANNEINQIQDITSLNPKQIKKVHKKFRKLDRSNKGFVSYDDFYQQPEINKNPVGDRITALLTSGDGKQIDFLRFVKAMADFSKDKTDEKLKFLFNMYDVDQDGFVNEKDMFFVMKLMVGYDLDDEQLMEVVKKTILDADEDEDGKLSIQEFKKVLTVEQQTQSQ
eukprot:TRINITY_DN8251_c0_g1_i3.p4 TRINITY_DN8251_c0_g1~~TRINITY_DN8251_c0_g1_i3.p4  ORF type:complete len:172 (-),score=32.33 TRINITY_DN8251_c0_g1_i3:11-526(-)